MVQQNAWVILLFNGKVGDVNIYSVILVRNSYGDLFLWYFLFTQIREISETPIFNSIDADLIEI